MTNDTLNLQEARTKCDQLEKLILLIPQTAVRAGFICDKMNCLMKENEEMKKKIITLNKMMRHTLEKNNAFQLITERDEANIKNFKLTKENEELKEELEMWKKYKHLDFEDLGKDEDYWDCVVQEHNLTRWEYDENKEHHILVYPDILEYERFCKYFPRPNYEDSEEEEEEEKIEEPFCENGLCNGGQKFEIKDKMFCSPMCGNKYFNLEEDDSYYWSSESAAEKTK